MLRNKWYDLGLLLAVIVVVFIIVHHQNLTSYQMLMWLNLISLFLHQAEEYRIAGTFPGMVNRIMYRSNKPDRFPLNAHSAFLINVVLGWTVYFLAAFLAERAIWIGIAAMVVSVGNIIAHSFIFTLKGKMFYNAGLITCWVLFLPCIYFFISIVYFGQLATVPDLCIGIAVGMILNFIGVIKMIDWLADSNTKYIFSNRQLLPQDRNK